MVILTDLSKDWGTDYKGKPMGFVTQCLEPYYESEYCVIAVFMYANYDMSRKRDLFVVRVH